MTIKFNAFKFNLIEQHNVLHLSIIIKFYPNKNSLSCLSLHHIGQNNIIKV